MAVVISSEAVDEDTIEDLVLEQPDQVREESVVGRSETEEQVVEQSSATRICRETRRDCSNNCTRATCQGCGGEG